MTKISPPSVYTLNSTESGPLPVEARWSWLSSPLLGAARSSQAMAPRKGGVTNEAMTKKRTARRSGMSLRDTSHPIGAATRQQTRLEETARKKVVTRGSMKVRSVKSSRKFARVGPPARAEKAKTASHPMGTTTRTKSAAAKRAKTAPEGSKRDVDARSATPQTLKYLL